MITVKERELIEKGLGQILIIPSNRGPMFATEEQIRRFSRLNVLSPVDQRWAHNYFDENPDCTVDEFLGAFEKIARKR